MKTRIIIGITTIAAVLTSCNKQDDVTDNTWNGEIRLSSGITAQTRASSADVPDKQIAANKVVSFFVDDAGTSVAKKNLYENYKMVADGNGGFTKSDPDGEAMYYPATGNGVNIYAFMTNGTVGGDFPATAVPHTVNGDQSVQYGDNYLASDLLYAARKGITRTPDAVEMKFFHLLSKIDVAIKAGDGMTSSDLTGAVVTIENTQLKANFLPVKTANINGTTDEAQKARAAMVALTATDNAVAPITIGTSIELDAFDEATIYASAVVVPQTVAKGKRFIKVKTASGGELFYAIPHESGLKLENGYKYQFQITVNLSGLTVKSTIADWATGAPIDGTAELPVPIGSKTDPATAAIGDFYFSDGTLEASTATLTQAQKAECIGIVFYKSLDGKTGKIVSLDEVQKAWSTENTDTGTTSDTDGAANMATILALPTYSATTYPAFAWCADKGAGWYIPAKDELVELYNAYNVDRTAFNNNLTTCGGAAFYGYNCWSATQFSSNYSWVVYFGDGNAGYSIKFGSDYRVRCVRAF